MKLTVQTISIAKQERGTVPNNFGKDKNLIPEVKPEHHAKARQKI